MNHEIAVELSKKIMELASNLPLHEEDIYLQIRMAGKKNEKEIVETLTRMINDWEIEISEDTSLYSLGLRRAIDIVEGNPPL